MLSGKKGSSFNSHFIAEKPCEWIGVVGFNTM